MVLAGLSVLSAACAPDVRDVGVAAVDAADLDALPLLALDEELRIGSVEDPDYGFSRIGSIDVDDDGSIYLFEQQALEIRVYSHDGRLLRRMGRRGDGPGEFRLGGPIGVFGDTVWLIESLAQRITLFDRSGRLLSAVRFAAPMIPWHREHSSARLPPGGMNASGYFISRVEPRGWPGGIEAPGVVREIIEVPRIRYDASGAVVDTVGWYTEQEANRPIEYIDVGRSRYRVPWAPTPAPLSATTVDGRIVIDSPEPANADVAELHITWHDLADSVVRRRTYRYRPLRFPEAEIDAFIAFTVRQGQLRVAPPGADVRPRADPADSARAHAAIRERVVFPAYQPAWGRVHIGADGGMWIRHIESDANARRWVGLDADGAPRGTIELAPPSANIIWSRGDALYVVERDELDVPWLVRYRVRSNGR